MSLLNQIPMSRRCLLFGMVGLLLPLNGLADTASARREVAPLLDRLEQRVRSIREYECMLENEIHGEKDSKSGTYRVSFRQPELMRIKVVGGKHKGSEICLTSSGGVRARTGGALKIFAISMARTDRRLYDPRGHSAWDASFIKLHGRLKASLAAAEQVQVTPTDGASGHRITLHSTDGGHKVKETWVIRPSGLPVERLEVEVDGKVVERTVFRDLKENPGLSDGFFKF